MSESYTNPSLFESVPIGWEILPIEHLCIKVTSGGTPLRSISEYYLNGTIPWYKTQELKDWRLQDSQEKITERALDQSSAKLLPQNTVLMAMYGDGKTITSLGIVGQPSTCNQACCALVANPEVCDYQFLFYSLKYHRNDFLQIATGGAQRNLSGTLIRNFALRVPPLSEQRAIAHILGTLDDKIELNRRMNETLEALARAIFKSWFVDFDPVRRNMARNHGRGEASPANPGKRWPQGDASPLQRGLHTPDALADIDALFPDSFEDSELGKIPQGWSVGAILEQADLLSGGTPSTVKSEYWDGDVLWASAKDVSQCGQTFLIRSERTITKLGLQNSATQIIPAFSTVIVARGATTGRLTMFGVDMAMNQTCYALRSQSDCHFALYCTLREIMGELVHAAHGSVFDTITTSTFKSSRVILAPIELQRAFDKVVEPLFQRVLSNLKESNCLEAVRDLLLPKLLSGEVRVV